MTDLFDSLPRRQVRPLTRGEIPCRACPAAACFFDGFATTAPAWCYECAPPEFKPGAPR